MMLYPDCLPAKASAEAGATGAQERVQVTLSASLHSTN